MKKRSDGRYQKRITLPNGKTKVLYSNAKNEREAIKDFNRQMLMLEEEHKKSLNFDNVAKAWANERFEKVQNNTLKQYIPCKNEAVNYFGDTPISEISINQIKAYLTHLEDRGLAKKTIKERYAILKQIFNYAYELEYIEKNPCLTVRLKFSKDMQTNKRESATAEEEKKIINAPNDIPFAFFAKFLLFTGCRRGEAFAITPNDIDLQNKAVTICKTVEWLGNKPQIKEQPKTFAGNREIPLPEMLIDELQKREKQNYIFQNEKGKLYDNSQITRGWDSLKTVLDIKCTPHQLRHSYATMLFDAGIDVKTAQKWLGHSDIKTTLDTYTHLSELRKAQSTEKWVKFLDEVVKK